MPQGNIKKFDCSGCSVQYPETQFSARTNLNIDGLNLSFPPGKIFPNQNSNEESSIPYFFYASF